MENKTMNEQENRPDVSVSHENGKDITETTHQDGRKDVNIRVNMLDVDAKDEATIKAKEVIESEIIPKLAEASVLVVVIHKPSNLFTAKIVKLPHVRAFAEAAIKKYADGVFDVREEDFSVVEYHFENKEVQVSTI